MNLRIEGLPVYESTAATERTNVPIKVHRASKGTPSYHARIQKKWVKRFGWVHKPCIFKTDRAFYVHPSLMESLTVALDIGTGLGRLRANK